MLNCVNVLGDPHEALKYRMTCHKASPLFSFLHWSEAMEVIQLIQLTAWHPGQRPADASQRIARRLATVGCRGHTAGVAAARASAHTPSGHVQQLCDGSRAQVYAPCGQRHAYITGSNRALRARNACGRAGWRTLHQSKSRSLTKGMISQITPKSQPGPAALAQAQCVASPPQPTKHSPQPTK